MNLLVNHNITTTIKMKAMLRTSKLKLTAPVIQKVSVPPHNEHSILVDMPYHQPNHQDKHSTTASKRKSVKITPKIQVRYKSTVINRVGKATGKYPNCWNVTSSDGSEKFINFDKIPQLQILNKKSTNSDNLEDETNLSNVPNNTEKEKCQEQELVEQQIPEEIIADEILFIQNKKQEHQAKVNQIRSMGSKKGL